MTKTHLTPRENFLRAVEFGQPEWIPLEFELLGATIHRHGMNLIDMMTRHEAIFPAAHIEACRHCLDQPLPKAGRRFIDAWGCEWWEEQPGIIGQVVGHARRLESLAGASCARPRPSVRLARHPPPAHGGPCGGRCCLRLHGRHRGQFL